MIVAVVLAVLSYDGGGDCGSSVIMMVVIMVGLSLVVVVLIEVPIPTSLPSLSFPSQR
jgi:hypothetical protein